MNTFGQLFRLTTFGESHGAGLGAVIDGCPAGIALTVEAVQTQLNRRRPGQSAITSARAEADAVEFISGVYEGKTLGTPIAALVRNQDARSGDYKSLTAAQRPGHADGVWKERFGHVDPRGGGRTSGRETLSRVIGGAVAEAYLQQAAPAVRVVAWVSQVGPVVAPEVTGDETPTRAQVDASPVRCHHAESAQRMEQIIADAKRDGDSWGGVITVRILGVPSGWGEPVFGKLKNRFADAFMSVGAVTGVVLGPADVEQQLTQPGSRFHGPAAKGQSWAAYGGIQGGLSNGRPMTVRVMFKPVSTLADVAKAGRHDPCILPRAVPVLEAMASLVLADAHQLVLARPHSS